MLWHQGHKWLIHATHALDQSWKTWKECIDPLSRENEIRKDYIERSVQALIQYHTFSQDNINVTLNISDEKTKITLIPRSVASLMDPLLSDSLAYGINISLPQTEAFLKREYNYSSDEWDKTI